MLSVYAPIFVSPQADRHLLWPAECHHSVHPKWWHHCYPWWLQCQSQKWPGALTWHPQKLWKRNLQQKRRISTTTVQWPLTSNNHHLLCYTWSPFLHLKTPSSGHLHLLDYVLINQKKVKDVGVTRAMSGPEFSTDHYMVKCKHQLTAQGDWHWSHKKNRFPKTKGQSGIQKPLYCFPLGLYTHRWNWWGDQMKLLQELPVRPSQKD